MRMLVSLQGLFTKMLLHENIFYCRSLVFLSFHNSKSIHTDLFVAYCRNYKCVAILKAVQIYLYEQLPPN